MGEGSYARCVRRGSSRKSDPQVGASKAVSISYKHTNTGINNFIREEERQKRYKKITFKIINVLKNIQKQSTITDQLFDVFVKRPLACKRQTNRRNNIVLDKIKRNSIICNHILKNLEVNQTASGAAICSKLKNKVIQTHNIGDC